MPSASITESGFADITFPPEEAEALLEMLKNRIRRLSHLEKAEPHVFSEISSMARICFVISGTEPRRWVELRRLSREDVECIYVLNHGRETERLLQSLNDIRQKVRKTGPVDLDISDQAAKSVFEVMET